MTLNEVNVIVLVVPLVVLVMLNRNALELISERVLAVCAADELLTPCHSPSGRPIVVTAVVEVNLKIGLMPALICAADISVGVKICVSPVVPAVPSLIFIPAVFVVPDLV